MKKTMHVLYVRIGTEHEKFGFEVNTLRPMKYDQIAKLLNSIAERFEWEKFMEGDKIILSRRDFNMSVLAAYTRPNSVSEIVKVHCKHCCYC
ncbi:glutamate--cysteine ligase, chloroplastic-like [Brassica napus]|uniref:glutamate--cysteine ligase, chloroplastic-like n=1 Tax=Brassica napus TaxID=3708 RepID=UPI0004F1853F|nr:glutamate--cysteine ligase, chloroplastic-like [Brassica napus]